METVDRGTNNKHSFLFFDKILNKEINRKNIGNLGIFPSEFRAVNFLESESNDSTNGGLFL
ncbi:hypothetical protein D1631_13360 [Chryseobacterium nematophagum]|uniref:Uncharacterized protein n=1 Tax=Chryseobacterium nematophagum TaxID=2305228 RepID=A0A3M7TKV5_9FLAO|nr:hypothetical protein D1631_13360 [Chryseobacterium nematophagum]